MISTGNDIVALSAIDRQRTIQHRFYSKILSPPEKELYSRPDLSGLPFEHFVWLLWSIKESAYKYCRRTDAGLIFSPLKIVVRRLEGPPFYKAVVHTGHSILYSRSTVHDDRISTVVSADEQFDRVWSGMASLDRADRASQSASVRALLLERLRSLLPGDGTDLHIEKDPSGCPLLYKGEKETGIPVSLAHHGSFIAYSFQLEREKFC
jgi:phosphopantetheinyl transferase (holo-ACP synthase)